MVEDVIGIAADFAFSCVYSSLPADSVPFGRLTLEDVARAAVGANGFAGMQDIEENARVLVPCRRAGQRAVQRQVFCRNFDGELVSHIDFPVCLMIDGARGEWYFFSRPDAEMKGKF